MNKKLFAELKEAPQQMADHAVGKEVRRAATYDDANFCVDRSQFDRFVSALDRPARDIPALRKLLTEPGVFDEK